MLSIGKLAPGSHAAAYYVERVGCPLDYYTGRGEAPGFWIGSGAQALGLDGRLDSPKQEEVFRRLLAGAAPDGTELVKPVLRADPRSRVPAVAVARALETAAAARGTDVADLLRQSPGGVEGGRAAGGSAVGGEKLVALWERTVADLDRARRRPRWPAPSLAVDAAQRLLAAAGVDPTQALGEQTPTGRFRDRLARALRHRDDRVDVRLPGLDLTLSAPKSVSLLWALTATHTDTGTATDPTRRTGRSADAAGHDGGSDAVLAGVAVAVREAHRIAVAESLTYLELTCTDALRGHHRGDGTDRRVATDGLVAAAFEHRSSRCGDPQLHTHVVVTNLLHGSDGKWSALDTREIYAHARTAGFVYQAVLRGELTRRLGVCWNPVRNGQAEIAGIPSGLLRVFSKRRQQIEAQLELLGLDTSAAAQAAALDTRPAKPAPADADHSSADGQEPVSVQDRWRAEATAAGYQPAQLLAALHQADTRGLITAARDATAATGPVSQQLAETLLSENGLTEKRATFDRRDLLRGVCERLPAGVPIRLQGLRVLATRVLRDARVVPLLGDAPVHARRYSTRELLALENDALTIAVDSQPAPDTAPGPAAPTDATASWTGVAVVPAAVLADAEERAATIGCTPEQTTMVRRLLSSGAGVEVVVGAAGAGKTTALAVAVEAWRQAGVPVHGTALAAIAARVLEDSADVPSRSLQRLFNHTEQPGSAPPLPPGGVLIVDEAGMVGTRQLHRLLTLAAAQQTKLVLVGDPKQLPEIDAGGLFATLAARLPTSTLLRNQRQAARWEQRALRELRDGDVVRALSAYGRHDRLRITDTLGDLTTRLLDDYEQHLTRHAPARLLVIASSRGDARRLNAQLRQRLLEHDHLGPDELRVPLLDRRDGSSRGLRGYRTGEQVLVTANDYPRGLLNGTRGTVTRLDHDELAVDVRLDDGRQIRLDRHYLAGGHLAHGYALTAHKAQGVTVDVSLLWGTQALTRETGYVALSRGRQANYLYSTWDLLRRDGVTDVVDLDRPAPPERQPDSVARRSLTRAALAQRLDSSGRQRTARSWWRRPQQVEQAAIPRRAASGRGR